MTTADTPPEPPPLPPSRNAWRFSLRSMLIGMTSFALLCGVLSVVPFASGIALGGLWLVVSGWLLTGIFFAHGDARAFCIGAAVVIASTWTGMGGQFLQSIQGLAYAVKDLITGTPSFGATSDLAMWFKHLILLASAVGNGWLCVGARRYFERRS